MAEKGEVFRCSLCGHVIEVKQEGEGDLTCCGLPMEGLTEKEASEFKGN